MLDRCMLAIAACMRLLARFPQVTPIRVVSSSPSTDGSIAVAVAGAAVRMRVRFSHAYIISISNGDGRCMANNVMRVQIPWPALRT
jgi:cephalosporin-C deacetylase-like acetyl esterase